MVGDHRKIGHPRSDLFPILLGHDSRHLSDVPEIVDDPGGQELAQGHRPKAGMSAREVEIGFGQVPGVEQLEVCRPESGEFLQEGRQGTLRISGPMPEPVVGLEDGIRPPGENDAGPGHPVGLFPVDEVPDDVERTERLGPFGGATPCLIEIAEQRDESAWSTPEHIHGQFKIKSHRLASAWIALRTRGESANLCHRPPLSSGKLHCRV